MAGKMSDQAVEILITNATQAAFIKYPEGDGGPNPDHKMDRVHAPKLFFRIWPTTAARV
jgi:hypothetical protein